MRWMFHKICDLNIGLKEEETAYHIRKILNDNDPDNDNEALEGIMKMMKNG